ncbi:hypothetical protein ARSQ2_01223 [Arsenophonus endosymbiont of Bemisia tabaci Q2]|nr:hypothetical protein ARSQ2_01223 [Arsenophonus endosymbiont of Bemisia tabaci Q2]
MRHRYFVRTQYGVIKIKSLSYNAIRAPVWVKSSPKTNTAS